MLPERRESGKPLLRLRSHFAPLVILSHHPIRLILMVLLPVAAMPEMRGALKFFLGQGALSSQLFIIGLLAFFILLPPLFFGALNCRKVRYDFYNDHLVFTENFFLTDKIRVPYRTLRHVTIQRSLLQRQAGIANIVLETAAGVKTAVIIPDIKNAPRALQRITKIVETYQNSLQATPS